MAKACHPDLHGESKNAEFQQLTHAYSVLSDSAKKAQYDANGFRDFEDFSDQEKAREMFRQKMQGAWKRRSWASIARSVVPGYAVVYVGAHVAVFIIDIPANALMALGRLCGSMLGM
jgi:curved DNA-binding protein CbpA